MKIAVYVVPVLILLLLIYCVIKRVNIYDAFVSGAKTAFPLVVTIFPYVAAIMLAYELFRESGLLDVTIRFLSPIFNFLNVPPELIPLIVLKPFSGSGSLAVLSEVYKNYGVNSYIALAASAVFGSSETIFYIAAVYYSKCKNKKATKAILISLFATFFSTFLTCFISKFFV